MAYVQKLQGSRFEYKYVIDEALVRPLREFAGSYLVRDAHAKAEMNWEYDVHSLYLDSPSLALCRATMQGHRNRFKLRVRFYDHNPASPAFFEIKRRVLDVILKQRAMVRRECVDALINGHWPERSHLCEGREEGFGALQNFCDLRDQLAARGRTFVSYKREAYVSPENDLVRMTFDRKIYATRCDGGIVMPKVPPLYPHLSGVVLELKFTDRFPQWMRQMLCAFDLERTSMAKYVHCIQALTNQSGGTPFLQTTEVRA